MSIAETASLEPAGRGSAPRRPWRAPQIIEAEKCQWTAAKTTFDGIERHNALSTSESS
jgi:hypothetical protein